VSIFYDPMIAKRVVWDQDRAAAARQLHSALRRVEVLGLKTNAALLAKVAAHPAFLAGEVHTGFLGEHAQELLREEPRCSVHSVLLACLGLMETRARNVASQRERAFASPWDALDGFRVNEGRFEFIRLRSEERLYDVRLRHVGQGVLWVEFDQQCLRVSDVSLDGTRLTCMCDGERIMGRYAEQAGQVFVAHAMGNAQFEHPWIERANLRGVEAGESVVKAPMPGKIIGVLVAREQRVQEGTPLVRLEAMKMEHTLKASMVGVVAELSVRLGEQVEAGSTLLVLKASEDGGT
jgi:3-methylcrotonyl-CoA carboxylase alpha subunit